MDLEEYAASMGSGDAPSTGAMFKLDKAVLREIVRLADKVSQKAVTGWLQSEHGVKVSPAVYNNWKQRWYGTDELNEWLADD